MNDRDLAIAVAFNWVDAAIVELTFPYLIVPVRCLLPVRRYAAALVFSLVCVKETKGLTKPEIKALVGIAK